MLMKTSYVVSGDLGQSELQMQHHKQRKITWCERLKKRPSVLKFSLISIVDDPQARFYSIEKKSCKELEHVRSLALTHF